MNQYSLRQGKILSADGLPYAPRWFCDNRLAFQADDDGIGDIEYYSAWGKGHRLIFHRQFWGGMRLYLYSAGARYQLRPQKCEIMPYGFSSETDIEGLAYSYRIYTASDHIFLSFTFPPQPDEKYAVGIEFYNDYHFIPSAQDSDLRYIHSVSREWGEWRETQGMVCADFWEEGVQTALAFCAADPLLHHETGGFQKHRITMEGLSAGKTHTLCLSFGKNAEAAGNQGKEAINNVESILHSMRSRYRRVMDKAPILNSGNPSLDNFFMLAPLYHESLKITDVPGGIRAKTTYYWMWGWDTMTSNAAAAYWGDAAFLQQMVCCLKKHSDNTGIAHAFGRNMQNIDTAPPAAQGIYICLLHLLSANGFDVSGYYPFALKLMNRILDSEKDGTGLCLGTSLVPDFRDLTGETGKDISTFNNGIAYCAIRSMEYLAGRERDFVTQKRLEDFTARMSQGFDSLFSQQYGFYDSSIDADTFVPRQVPSNNALKLENQYLWELTEKNAQQCADFYEKELFSPSGIRPCPVWCRAYDNDANQLSSWWPNITEFFAKTANKTDRPELMDTWIGFLTRWSDRLMFPEGISCYADNPSFAMDNWNTQSGTWQAFAMRSFYGAVVEHYIGIGVDCGGITFYPYSGREIHIQRLHYAECLLNVHMLGSGKYIDEIRINGKAVQGTNKLPFDLLAKDNEIEVYRTQKAPKAFIQSAYQVKITDYSYEQGEMRFCAQCYGRGHIRFMGSAAITVNGRRHLINNKNGESITI